MIDIRSEYIDAIASRDIEKIKRLQQDRLDERKGKGNMVEFRNGKWIVLINSSSGNPNSQPMTSEEFAAYLEKSQYGEIMDMTHGIYLQCGIPEYHDERPYIERIKKAESMKPIYECTNKEMEEIYGIRMIDANHSDSIHFHDSLRIKKDNEKKYVKWKK